MEELTGKFHLPHDDNGKWAWQSFGQTKICIDGSA